MDRAEPGNKPVRPNKPLNLFLGAFLGAVLGAICGGWTLLLSRLSRKPIAKR